MITNILKILSLQPQIAKVNLDHIFFTVGQNNFGNKVPFVSRATYISDCKNGSEFAQFSVIEIGTVLRNFVIEGMACQKPSRRRLQATPLLQTSLNCTR